MSQLWIDGSCTCDPSIQSRHWMKRYDRYVRGEPGWLSDSRPRIATCHSDKKCLLRAARRCAPEGTSFLFGLVPRCVISFRCRGFGNQVSGFVSLFSAYKVRGFLFPRGRDSGPGAYLSVVLGISIHSPSFACVGVAGKGLMTYCEFSYFRSISLSDFRAYMSL